MPSQMFNFYNQAQQQPPMFSQQQNPMQSKFMEFVTNFRQTSNQSPEEVVRQLLNSGQMSQEQFNSYRNMANMLTNKRL